MVGNRKESIGRCKGRDARVPRTQAGLLKGALEWFLKDCSFIDIHWHGNVAWKATELVALAVLWSWSDQSTLTGAFEHARQLAGDMFDDVAVTSYQGLTGALRAYTEPLLLRLWMHLHALMEKVGGTYWRIGRWLPLAVDGSRVTTPRTAKTNGPFPARTMDTAARHRAARGGRTKSDVVSRFANRSNRRFG